MSKDEVELMHELEVLMDKHDLSVKEVKALLKKKESLKVPVTVFVEKLTPLETIVKYLKEEKGYKYSEMEPLLGRDQRVLGVTYKRAKNKMRERLDFEDTVIKFPAEILSESDLSVFEQVVTYLKDHYDLSYAEIASLMKRDDRTVWTIHDRAKKKIESFK